MRRPLALSLAAGLLLAGTFATAASAAGPIGASTPTVTTQSQSVANDPAGQDLQSGLQQGSQSQTGLDTEQTVAKTPEASSSSEATTAADPAGGPNQNVQQGLQSQSGGPDGAAGGQ